jgi:hypothetical protein
MVWTKARTTTSAFTFAHALMDTLRGAGIQICSDRTDANTTQANSLTSFNSDGYTLGADTGQGRVNNSSYGTQTYVGWTFRKQAKFFDVVTYTGDDVDNRAIPHLLGSVPGCMILKATVSTTNLNSWAVYHRSLPTPPDSYLILNATSAYQTYSGFWGTTGPDANNFYIDSAFNESGKTYVVYLYAHNAGGFGLTGTDNVISCGSYTGNGASTGPTVNLGYEPQWLMVKAASSDPGYPSNRWTIIDNMRGWPSGPNANSQWLMAHTNDSEQSGGGQVANMTSTGFTVGGERNDSGVTFIYIAIRRGPMKVPTSGTSVFNTVVRAGTGTATSITGVGFPPDFMISHSTNVDTNNVGANDKLRGVPQFLATNTTGAEGTISGALVSLDQDGFSVGTTAAGPFNSSGQTNASWIFRRAPSFFDEVCYTGDGTADGRTFTHNLGATPQLVIVKRRSSTSDWVVMFNTDHAVLLNSSNADTGYIGATGNYANGILIGTNSTTLTQYSGASGNSACNASGSTYVAYLFATATGVSKVGSYTGTGTTQTINCGFGAGGSRFVLIKRTDSTGDWYVWDSARGMVSGTDPSLLLNSTAAEVNANSIYTISTGFQIVSTAAGINASGGSYIFLSVA